VLGLHIAGAQAEFEASTGEGVHRGDLAGEQRRVPEARVEDERALSTVPSPQSTTTVNVSFVPGSTIATWRVAAVPSSTAAAVNAADAVGATLSTEIVVVRVLSPVSSSTAFTVTVVRSVGVPVGSSSA
jgi:hypothetical protein